MENGGKEKVKRGRRPKNYFRENADSSVPIRENDSRTAILHTARKMFADKGYDGTSVADIAETADVNKALIFYYFGNKENILKEILKISAEETVKRREDYLNKENPFSPDIIRVYYEEALRVMESKKEIIKILLVEAIKNSSTSNMLFDFLSSAMGDIPQKMNCHGFQINDRDKLLTSEFFFDAMALFVFVALEEKWSEKSGISREKVRKYFLEVFNSTYLDYISNNYYKR